MVETLIYVLPLILGRTFDLDKMMVGVDIFQMDVVSNPSVVQNPFSNSRYSIVDSVKEVRDLLDVSGSFSLKVKGGIFSAGASGAYLTDTYNRENTVEVLIKMTYESVTETLANDASPVSTWKRMESLGTHYVRSITYGGEFLASVRLICNNTRDKQHIKASLEVGGKISVFDIGAEVEGEYMKDVSKTIDKMEIKIFSSIPINRIPHSMEELKKALDKFPEDLKTFNGGKGVPIKMELWPLDYLDSTRPQHIKNGVLPAYLEMFEEKFDDLLNTKYAISDWMKSTEVFSSDAEAKIGKLYGDVQKALRTFYKVIGVLDSSQGISQLQPALDVYGNEILGHFYNRYQILRNEIVGDKGSWNRESGTGVTYIHWGKKNCIQSADTVYSGYAVGPAGSGGGSNHLCLPEKQTMGKVNTSPQSSALDGSMYELPTKEKSQIVCSVCRLSARGCVQTFSGLHHCPSDWYLLYKGILMSGSNDNAYTSFICLETEITSQSSIFSESPFLASWIMTGESKSRFQDIVPCIVCSK